MIDIDESTLRNLVDFCYTGSIKIDEENVHSLLAAACLLQMQEVEDFCCRFLKDQLDVTNCLGIRNFAESHACRDLFKESDRFMRKNLEVIILLYLKSNSINLDDSETRGISPTTFGVVR